MIRKEIKVGVPVDIIYDKIIKRFKYYLSEMLRYIFFVILGRLN